MNILSSGSESQPQGSEAFERSKRVHSEDAEAEGFGDRRTFLGGVGMAGVAVLGGAHPGSATPKLATSFDVVIVGGGTAGCVLAARLSEDPRRRVLLVEAGPDYGEPARLPADIRNGRKQTRSHDWGYKTDPLGAPPREIALPRARLLGGCSATNATTALRGHPVDFDEWGAGTKMGWTYSELQPAFCRLECDLDFRASWHGQVGPLPIVRVTHSQQSPFQQAIFEACLYRHGDVLDHNSPGAIGVGPIPRNVLNGIRQSTLVTYLAPVRVRANLTVRAGSLVESVLFDRQRAIAVRLAGSGDVVYGGKVILCAGTYGSAQLLMRSGIGPAEQLRALRIRVVKECPGVGRGLIDHPMIIVRFGVNRTQSIFDVPSQNVLSFRSSEAATPAPDLQAIAFEKTNLDRPGTIGILLALMKPRSTGLLKLRSRDPEEQPLIDQGYLVDQLDVSRLIEGLIEIRRIAASRSLSSWIDGEIWPGRAVENSSTLASLLRESVESYCHPVGSCRMGPASDPHSVVSFRGAVHGVDALSVVDASIMPTIPSANTHLSTVMVAERVSEWLGQ